MRKAENPISETSEPEVSPTERASHIIEMTVVIWHRYGETVEIEPSGEGPFYRCRHADCPRRTLLVRRRGDRPQPAHALSVAERAEVLRVANEPRFADMPPARIVPMLADEGVYIASESTFARVLREHG
jgi:hypothetical protein